MLPPETEVEAELRSALYAEVVLAIADAPAPFASLTPGEATRHASLAGPRRDQWLVGRAALKRLLRRVGEDEDTSAIAFPSQRFSLSHSGDIAVALALDAPDVQGVGVDLEAGRTPHKDIARLFLTAEERGLLGPALRDGNEVLRLWTVKEALFKADPRNDGRLLHDYQVADVHGHTGAASASHDASLRMRYATLALPGGFLSAAISCRELTR